MKLLHLTIPSMALLLSACVMKEMINKPADIDPIATETPQYSQEEITILTDEASWFPNVYISASGKLVQGIVSYNDRLCNSNSKSTDIAPLRFPESLGLEAGKTMEILVTGKTGGSALIVTELDLSGVPIASTVLKINTSKITYAPASKVDFLLQVTVQSSWNQFATYLFNIIIM